MAEKNSSSWSSKLQKIPLAFKFSSLNEALTNEEISVPGYIFEEMNKICFQSNGVCEDLLDFLLLTLDTTDPIQKLKSLKILKHLTVNGPSMFREKLKKSDRMIQEATGFNGPNDAIHGNSLNTAIRSEANELMHTLFDESINKEYGLNTNVEQVNANYFTGMGSSIHTGKYEGFGNTPIIINKTVVDKVVDGLNVMVEKIMTTTDDNEIIQDALKVDSGGYHAVQLPAESPIFDQREESSGKVQVRTRASIARLERHVPGRAGGGWDDADSENVSVQPELSSGSSNKPNKVSPGRISEDSLETEQKLAPEIDEPSGEENEFVENIIETLSSSKSWMDLDTLSRRCTSLNCERLLEVLHDKLKVNHEEINISLLIFVEALLYQDIVPIELLQSVFNKTLEQLSTSSTNPIKIKSQKILLILNKLSEQNLAAR